MGNWYTRNDGYNSDNTVPSRNVFITDKPSNPVAIKEIKDDVQTVQYTKIRKKELYDVDIVVNGFIKQARSLFPADNPYFDIVDGIQQLIMCYYYDPYDINEKELGQFIEDKMDEKMAKRLLRHLKGSSKPGSDNTDDDTIPAQRFLLALCFFCVLFLKYVQKTEKRLEVKFDRKKLKKSLTPSYNWILENRLKETGTLKKSQYKILGKWFKEFYAEKQKT